MSHTEMTHYGQENTYQHLIISRICEVLKIQKKRQTMQDSFNSKVFYV